MISTSLSALSEAIIACTACTARSESSEPVSFESPRGVRDLMIIGRNPGIKEDEVGRPFVGPGGKLLDEWIKLTNLSREDFWITNLIKCYTYGDRAPDDYEVRVCTQHHLFREIGLCRPKVIVALGKQTLHFFYPGARTVDYHGKFHDHVSSRVFYINHPGYVLRGGYSREEWLRSAEAFREGLNND